MRIHYLLFAFVVLAAGCNTSETQTSNEGAVETAGDEPGAKKHTSRLNGYWQKLVMHEIGDGKGNVAAVMPMPASWKFTREGITGPNGIKVTDYPLQTFMVNYDQNLRYAYSQTRQREMPGIEQLIQEDFIPWGNDRGLQFVKSYELPEVTKMDKWYSDQLYKAMPSRSDITAYGTEWKNKNGDPYFVLIHLNASTTQQMQNWSYYYSGLEADPAHFEAARKQYIFSLANTRYNLEPIMAYNKAEAQRIGQSWAAFNQRMIKNQADFEASQRAFVNKSDAINESIMSSWKAQNASSDKQQEQRVDGIYERTNVQDAETGQKYKVQEGANQYWMNNDGEYIGTKLSGYDPNLDDNMNDQKWKELQRVRQ